MWNVVLFATEGRPDNLAVPLWQPLVVTPLVGTAHAVFKRAVQQCKASQLLWAEVTPDGMIGVRGFLDVGGWIEYNSPGVDVGNALEATGSVLEAIARQAAYNERKDHAANQRPAATDDGSHRVA